MEEIQNFQVTHLSTVVHPDLNLHPNSSALSLAGFVPVGYISIHLLLSIISGTPTA